ncbi:MAG: hypothetical protein WDW38_002361 [Sanguina aurantia]
MGAYLSSPVTSKETFEGEGKCLRYGGCAMQGWRRTMEDAHVANTAVGNDPDVACFAVLDGHGGSEVAKFCQKYIVNEISRCKEYQSGDVEASLVRGFHRIDEMLRDSRHADEIEAFKTRESFDDDEDGPDGNSANTLDTLNMLKRVFQMRGTPAAAAASSASAVAIRDGAEAGEGAAAGSASRAAAGNKLGAGAPDEGNGTMVQAGCTAVVVLKVGDQLYCANAGDSRGVLARAGKAVALSEDHKPAQEGERARIISAGGFLSDIGGMCRVNGNLNLSRAIGDLKYKQNADLPPEHQIITAHPDIRRETLGADDKFVILACDGVWDVMSNQDAVDFVGQRLDQGMSPTQAGCALLDACLANDPKEARGVGCDNMTVVVVQLQRPASSSGSAAAAPPAARPAPSGTQ